MGDSGTESGYELGALSYDLACSVSDESEQLLKSSQFTEDPRMVNLWVVRSIGLPFLLRPSLDGLPGAPAGSLSVHDFGTMN
jgi:hypothetical protein